MSDNVFSSLQNHFLLAMPGLQDPNFAHSVIFICDHSPEGAMGLTINQPIDIPMSRIFEQFELDYTEEKGREPLFAGGPVQVERGFVLHRPANHQWESTLTISPEICLTASSDIIVDIARDRGPPKNLITLGYAGWGAGQLEQELVDNTWLVTPADPAIIFDMPFTERARAVAASIGIDLDKLSSQPGHA
jgi:putative transcriptional regulator